MKDNYYIDQKKRSKKDYSVSKKMEPEYVLKVNSSNKDDISIKVEPKKQINPQSSPKKRKKKRKSKIKKFILLILLFIFVFLTSLTIGYNLIFKLFEL